MFDKKAYRQRALINICVRVMRLRDKQRHNKGRWNADTLQKRAVIQ